MSTTMDFHSQITSIMEVLANAAVAKMCKVVDDGYAVVHLEMSRSQKENESLCKKIRVLELQIARYRAEKLKGAEGSSVVSRAVRLLYRQNRASLTGPSLQSRTSFLSRDPGTQQFVQKIQSDQDRDHEVVTTTKTEGQGCLRGTSNTLHEEEKMLEVQDHVGEDSSTISKRKVKSTILENTCTQQSQLVVATKQLLEPEVVLIKKEKLEEELTGCSVLEDHQTSPKISIGPQSLSVVAESNRPLSIEAEIPRINVSCQYDNQDFPRPEALQQEEKEGVEETGTPFWYSHPAHQSHRGGGPNKAREMTDLIKEEKKHVFPSDSLSTESSCSKVPDGETALMATLDSESSPINTEVKGLCGAAADWKGEAVKLEAESSWSEAIGTCNPLLTVTRNECVSNSTITNTISHHTECKAAELDTSSLDSSFDDLFSSPEVARSLTAPHKHSINRVIGIEGPLSSHLTSSFPFQSGENSFGNCSMSDSGTVSSFSIDSSDSRSRSFTSSAERAFSCHQCSHFFSTSRELVVHQRSHTRERIYHCHLCRKPFVHQHQLKTHQRVHTGEKPFSCTQCGKRFSQSSHIKRHMSVHTGEKRYSCSLCGKRFSQACSLKVHQTVHTGERPYRCTKCGKSFSVLGNLVRHHSVHIGK